MKVNKIKTLILLQLAVFIYSIVSVFSKISSSVINEKGFFSFSFITCVILMFITLGIYAIIWQFTLKKIDLSIAYANKGLTLFWSIIWSSFLFKESINTQNIIGIIVIIIGVVVISYDS